MWDGPNLFKIMEAEWSREAGRRPARSACARWARNHAVLEGMASPTEVVQRCQARGHPRRSADLLAAVLSHAGEDPWAARTVLQAVLPGLASVSRRARPLVGPMGVWSAADELDQHLMTIACERIATLANEAPRPWPAAAIVDATWQRLRDFASAERRRSGRRADLAELGEPISVAEASAAEELAHALSDAVERGILEPLDGWLVFASRVQGEGVEHLAAEMGCHPRWLWRRRVHAEQLLAGTGPMLAAG